MKERPMLFSTTMVQAKLASRKKKTRRIIKAPLDNRGLRFTNRWEDWHGHEVKCPYGATGDVIWVRETWGIGDKSGAKYYRANTNYPATICRWRPSIHMPKAAARIWSLVTDIKVERLQDITAEDAIAEGIESMIVNEDGEMVTKYRGYGSKEVWYYDPIKSFKSLWESINGHDTWKCNPWVWVVSFRVLSTTGRPANLEELCADK